MKTNVQYEIGFKRPTFKHYRHETDYALTLSEAKTKRQNLKNSGFIQTYIRKIKG